MNDLYRSIRSLMQRPGFVLVAVITLAFGIGVNSAVFSLVNAILLRPLPVQEPDRLIVIYNTGEVAFIRNHLPLSYPDYVDYRDQNDVFSELILYNTWIAILGQGDLAEMSAGEIVSGNFFEVLGVKPVVGRTLQPDDDRAGAEPVAMLSYATWQRRFGGNPSVIGQTVEFTGQKYTVVGIAPETFTGMIRGLSPEFWIPVVKEYSLSTRQNDGLNDRHNGQFTLMGRLKPGRTIQQATANLQTVARRLEQSYPETNKGRGVFLMMARDIAVHPDADGPVIAASGVVMALAGLVLLIACANLANLLLARATGRRKEIAIRLALGESRSRLLGSLLGESILLSLAGGAAGLLLAAWCNDALNVIRFPIPVQVALGLRLDSRVVGFTFLVALLTGALFGLVPAWQAFKTDVFPALKDEGASHSSGRRKARLRNGLVIAQVTLSLVLLIFAGLAARSLRNAASVNPGFNANNLVVASFALSLKGYDEKRYTPFYRDLLENVQRLPGVQSATLTTGLPLVLRVRLTKLRREGQENLAERDIPFVDETTVWPGYFATMQIPIVQGREFSETDNDSAPKTAVINEALAKEYWPNENPLGKRLVVGFPKTTTLEVVGVAKNGKYRTLGENPRPFLYSNLLQDSEGLATLVLRVSGDEGAALAGVRNVVRTLDPGLPMFGVQTMKEQIGPSMMLPQYAATFFGAFGVLGALLAIVGLYGVISYSVSQRTQEMGIRIALGGRPADVLRLVMVEGMRLTAIGLACGLLIAGASSRMLSVILYGIQTTDAVTFIGVSLMMIVVTLLACYVPARRATKVDPITALRYE